MSAPHSNGRQLIGVGESVVHNQGHAMLVGDAGKLFNVENLQCGVGDCFAEQCLGVRTESGGDFFFGCIRD